MLQVKSFDISDDKGINELLQKYRLASGAHILVSEGKVCIPYEDGEPRTPSQQRVAICEDQNKLREQIDIIVHSQGVMDLLVADAEDRFKVAEAEWDKNRSNKDLERKKNEAAAGVEDAKRQKRSNEFEIVRLQRNIDLYDVQLKKLA